MKKKQYRINVKYYACKLYLDSRENKKNGKKHFTVQEICDRYHITNKNTLYFWLSKFDGTKASLINKSRKPLDHHPNCHTAEELRNLSNLVRRNPNITLNELYGKMIREKGYTRTIQGMYHALKMNKIKYHTEDKKKNKNTHKKGVYHTPKLLGHKWQIDVKYVPNECKTTNLPFDKKYYIYSVIEEASRETFSLGFDSISVENSIIFMKQAIEHFQYQCKVLQNDNGNEFVYTTTKRKDLEHPFTSYLKSQGIRQYCIPPRSPMINGKIERYNGEISKWLKDVTFYSLEDLNKQLQAFLKRRNNSYKMVLGYKSPMEVRKELLKIQPSLLKKKKRKDD